jgi:hypothetical protein
MVSLTILRLLVVVELGSGSSVRHCAICGSELVVIKYVGHERDKLALMESEGFCCFMGCLRVDLHEGKMWKGVDGRGKVFVHPVFHSRDVGKRKRMP